MFYSTEIDNYWDSQDLRIGEGWRNLIIDDEDYLPMFIFHTTFRKEKSRTKKEKTNKVQHLRLFNKTLCNSVARHMRVQGAIGRNNHTHQVFSFWRSEIDCLSPLELNIFKKVIIDVTKHYWKRLGRIEIHEYDFNPDINFPSYSFNNEERKKQQWDPALGADLCPYKRNHWKPCTRRDCVVAPRAEVIKL